MKASYDTCTLGYGTVTGRRIQHVLVTESFGDFASSPSCHSLIGSGSSTARGTLHACFFKRTVGWRHFPRDGYDRGAAGGRCRSTSSHGRTLWSAWPRRRLPSWRWQYRRARRWRATRAGRRCADWRGNCATRLCATTGGLLPTATARSGLWAASRSLLSLTDDTVFGISATE